MILRVRPLTRAALAVPATLVLLTTPVTLALLACAAPEASRQLYQWTDADGNVRYTPFPGRIPVARRDTRRVVGPGMGVASEPALAPATRVSGAPAAPAPGPTGTPVAGGSDLDARIAALETRISVDEEALKSMISDPAQSGSLRDSDALREIAQRLPALQAELARLRSERDGSAGGSQPAGSAGDAP